MKVDYIVVFYSTSYSLQLFKILRNNNYKISLISTPCTISSGCARAIEFQEEDLGKISQIIKDNNIVIRGVYKRVIENKRLYYVRISI